MESNHDGTPSSMPEIYALILTRTELRDLTEYVASLGTPEYRGSESH